MAMSFVGEFKFAIYFTRLMGLAPYKIGEKHLELSPIAILYSIIVHLIYIYSMYAVTVKNPDDWNKNLTTMMPVRIGLVVLSLLIDFILSLLRHRKFCAFINRINKFDEMINLSRITKKREYLLSVSVLVPLVIHVTIQIYFNYAQNFYWRDWQLGFTLHFVGLSVIVCQFSIIVFCVLRRFQHLNRFIIAGQVNPVGVNKFHRRQSRLRDVWILYADLMDASEELNSIFTYQLSFWISTLAFNIITRIYTIWDGSLDMKQWEVIFNGLSAATSLLLLTNLLAICHFTTEEANNVGATVFCCRSNIFQMNLDWDKEDTFSIGHYFVLRRFYFTAAAGLLRIDLPLLQTIAGVITTYLVILKTPKEHSSVKG